MEQSPFNPNNLSNKELKPEKTKSKVGTLSVRVKDGVYEKIKKENLNGDFLNDLGVSGFDEFAEKYYQTIFKVSFNQLQKYGSKNSSSDASDIAQDIIIKLMNPRVSEKYKKSEVEDKEKNAENWLKVITKNYTIDRIRERLRDKSITNTLENEEGQDMPFRSSAQDPLEEFLANESQAEDVKQVQVVEEIISKLPKELRDAINLAKDGLNYQESSQKLNVPEGTYKSRLFRAKEFLRKKLAGKGYKVVGKRSITNGGEE